MGLLKNRYNGNDATMLLKYALISLLGVLLPITLFLTGFSWSASLEVHASDSEDITGSILFLKNSLVFGTIALLTSLFYFSLVLFVSVSLNRVSYKWKKIILFVSLFVATVIFLLFEIFSIVFISYYYNWQLSLALIFWPLLYVVLLVLLLVNYFSFYNEQKKFNQDLRNPQENNLFFIDQTVDSSF